jgi:DNA polymerase-1
VIYGQSAHGLSQQLQIPRAEAQQFIDRYFRQYPSVRAFIEGVKEEARKTGRVKTIFNRVRNLSEGLNSSNRSVREFSERAAFNTPLQGSAADLMKAAMIRLAHKLEREQARARIILQVHDELVLEVPDDEADNVTAWIEWAMALDQPLNVPLDVDIHRGASWMET